MRIAFLTPEFVTEYGYGGGLGNYLNRFTKELVKHGYEVEVFVSSFHKAETINHEGVLVHRVPHGFRRRVSLPLKLISMLVGISHAYDLHVRSWRLSRALEARHKNSAFDVVQCSDYLSVGLHVRKIKERKLVVRCSSAADLYNAAVKNTNKYEKERERLEIESIRRADRAYAPSRFIAEHLQKTHGLDVEVIRPPYAFEVKQAKNSIDVLPARFLVHFGQLSTLKGTDWLIRSLKLAFKTVPDLRVVMVGVANISELNGWLNQLGDDRFKVLALYPVAKDVLYGVLSKADAAIIPSRADNLPNTLLESLMHGLPIIGTNGVSIDELVTDGLNGLLVEKDNDEALADAIIRYWRGDIKLSSAGFLTQCKTTEDFEPSKAVESFLNFVKVV